MGQQKRAFGNSVVVDELIPACVDYAYAVCADSSCCAPTLAAGSNGHQIGGVWGEENKEYGILDGGAVSSCASYEIIQMIADEWEPLGRTTSVEPNGGRRFVFGGGERTSSSRKAVAPNDYLPDGLGINVVGNPNTPLLLGLDTIRQYGLVLDYYHDTAYSHILERYIPSEVLSSEHMAVRVLPDPQHY